MTNREALVRDCYGAYVSGDRGVLERTLADDFTFSSPPDVGLDRERYFERCWPNARLIAGYEFVRLNRRRAVPQHRGAQLRRGPDPRRRGVLRLEPLSARPSTPAGWRAYANARSAPAASGHGCASRW